MPPIAVAPMETALGLVAKEAALFEQRKADARAAAKAAGMTDAEIDALLPSHPAGTFIVEC
jgi:hypothetical protein